MSENATPTTDQKELHPLDLLEKIGSGENEKFYLNPRKATTWFYRDNPAPSGKILTNILSMDPLVIRAEVWIKGEIVATGHANAEGKSNTLKRIESAAIRRALANAGYGTDQVIAKLAKDIGPEKSKQMLGSGKAKQERRLGDQAPTDTRNPIAILTAGLEENGTTLELSAVALGIKDANDIEQWRQFGTTPKAIATEVKRANAKPFGQPKKFNGNGNGSNEPASTGDVDFDAIPSANTGKQPVLPNMPKVAQPV